MAKKKTSTIDPEMLDELLAGQDRATVLRSDGLLDDLKKALAERMLQTRRWTLTWIRRLSKMLATTARAERQF